MTSQIDDYILSNICRSQLKHSFDDLFNQFIINVPERAVEFRNFHGSWKARALSKIAASELNIRFPNEALASIFIECFNQDHSALTPSGHHSYSKDRSKELTTIINVIFYSLKIYDHNLHLEIRSDYLIEAIELFSELRNTEAISHGKKFQSGRKKGAIGSATLTIRDLIKQYHSLSSKELQEKSADKEIRKMNVRTFSNKVTQARKAEKLKKPKKSTYK